MKTAIYARVSSEKQAKGGTINSQIEALREFAKQNELTITHECIDDGYSGGDLNRPGLDHLRDLAQDGEIEAALVLAPDRLSRNQSHQIILLDEFKKRNTQVIFTNQPQGDSPENNLMMQIHGAISEYERAKILDRTRRGMKHSVKNGQVIGGNTPYGYSHVLKSANAPAHWEINPYEAEIVRLIYDWYANHGMALRAIARRLEEQRVPSRAGNDTWQTSSVHSILTSDAYTGTAYMFKTRSIEPGKHPKQKEYRQRAHSSKTSRPRDEWMSITVPQIIDHKTWEAVQRKRKKNAIFSPRNNKRHKYLLRGLVVCGLCGSMAAGYVSNLNTYYSCGARRNRNLRTTPHDEKIQASHPSLDQRVWDGLVHLLDDPKNLHEQLKKRLEAKNRLAHSDPLSDKTQKDSERLSLQEQRVIDAYRDGVISLAELKDQKAKLSTRRKVMEAKKKAVPGQPAGPGQPKITMSMLGDVSARFRRAMPRANFANREKLVNLLVNSVTLYSDKAVVEGTIPVTGPDALGPPRHAAPLHHPQFISRSGRPPGCPIRSTNRRSS